VASDGRVYAHWFQLGAKTGRMASGQPNMQNMPRDPAYRQCFCPGPGRVLVKADYSQIELRIAAKVANETRMIEAYRRGDDLHILTAQRMTGKTEVTKQERQLAKPVNFGLIYGLGAASLCRKAKTDYDLDLSEDDARRYRRAFFAAYPAIQSWHNQIKRRRATETRTLSGRRVLVAADGFFGAKANYIVQGTGADGVKLALALLWERRDQAPGALPVLAVHDEIVVEARADEAEAAAAWLRQAMQDAMVPLLAPVPVEVEVGIAPTWGGG
jgi:DNA polymerase-1